MLWQGFGLFGTRLNKRDTANKAMSDTQNDDEQASRADGEEGKPESADQPAGTIAEEGKDDCSDLTDNNNDEAEEQTPKSFPQKLMEILSNDEYSDVISWLPHGNGFVIHKKKTFASEILPRHFKASKFTSFTRKLNRWGFTRASRGPETGAYFHKLFRRDKPDYCLQMTSNSGNKYYHTAPMQQHLLPAGPGLMSGPAVMQGGVMPFGYMPVMMGGGGPLSPQQQQALWQQHMQVFQLQQMQMMQMQAQQQQQGGMRMPMPGMQPPVIQPMAPHQPGEVKPAADSQVHTGSTNSELKATEGDESLDVDTGGVDTGPNLDGIASEDV